MFCDVCECDPCDCDSEPRVIFCPECGDKPCNCGNHKLVRMGDMIQLQYDVGGKSFSVYVPLHFADQYQQLYSNIRLMDANGSVIEYSGGVSKSSGVGGKE